MMEMYDVTEKSLNVNLLSPASGADLNADVTDMYNKAFGILNNAYDQVQVTDLHEALSSCHEFLKLFGFFDKDSNSSESMLINFRAVASQFLSGRHSYETLLYLNDMRISMLNFCETFLHAPRRRGVIEAMPVIRYEDVMFVYSFCAGLYNLSLQKVSM